MSILLFVAGCSAAPGSAVDETGEPRSAAARPAAELAFDPMSAPPPRAPRNATLDPPDLVAWTTTGDLVVADGWSGAVRQAVPTPGAAEDLVFDRASRRLWVAVAGGDGEVGSHPVADTPEGPALGERAHEAWTDGPTRMHPWASGVVLLEEGAMRLLTPGAGGGPPRSAPAPAAAWVTEQEGGAVLHALSYGAASGELDVLRADLGAGGLGPAVVALLDAEAGGLPPCARVVPAPRRGGALLVDVEGSFLTVRSISGATAGPAALVALGAEGLRIEAATSLDGGAVVVLLISGLTRLVAVEIDPELQVASVAREELPGIPTPAVRLLSHALVPHGPGRVLAATSAGVFAAEVWRSATGVHLALRPTFAGGELRGPIASL